MVTDFAFDALSLRAARRRPIPPSRTSAASRSSATRSRPASAPLPDRALAAGYHGLLLAAARARLLVPGDPADRRALPHRDRAAGALLPPRRPRQRRALRRPREGDGRRGATMRDRRAQRPRPHLEGRSRRVHLHRMRPLQGRLPDVPHRQAAVAQVGERQRQAPPAGAARARSPPAPGRRAAGARPRRDQRRDAVGVHDLRLLRSRLSDRARAPAASSIACASTA